MLRRFLLAMTMLPKRGSLYHVVGDARDALSYQWEVCTCVYTVLDVRRTRRYCGDSETVANSIPRSTGLPHTNFLLMTSHNTRPYELCYRSG